MAAHAGLACWNWLVATGMSMAACSRSPVRRPADKSPQLWTPARVHPHSRTRCSCSSISGGPPVRRAAARRIRQSPHSRSICSSATPRAGTARTWRRTTTFHTPVWTDGRSINESGRRDMRAGSVAENIAAGPSTAQAVVDGWMQSTGHCQNIMNGGLRRDWNRLRLQSIVDLPSLLDSELRRRIDRRLTGPAAGRRLRLTQAAHEVRRVGRAAVAGAHSQTCRRKIGRTPPNRRRGSGSRPRARRPPRSSPAHASRHSGSTLVPGPGRSSLRARQRGRFVRSGGGPASTSRLVVRSRHGPTRAAGRARRAAPRRQAGPRAPGDCTHLYVTSMATSPSNSRSPLAIATG